MKKLLVLAAIASFASPAFASKARMTALGPVAPVVVVDAQTAFDNPSHLMLLGDYVTLESGNDVMGLADTTPDAEGGFVTSMGDNKFGFYVGRKSEFTDGARKLFGFLQQENALEFQYAGKTTMNWGAALNYSASDKKTSEQKQTAIGGRVGANAEGWDAFLVFGLGSSADGSSGIAGNTMPANPNGTPLYQFVQSLPAAAANADATYKGTTGFKVGGEYETSESTSVYGIYYMDGAKVDDGTTELNIEQSQLDIGVVESVKLDAGQFFYGVAYQMFTFKEKETDTKAEATFLPFTMGMEVDATSWMVARTSVTQNVLLGSTKQNGGDADSIGNNTTVAAGLGLKFNKFVLDGVLAGSNTSGNIDMNDFMTQVGLTYNF